MMLSLIIIFVSVFIALYFDLTFRCIPDFISLVIVISIVFIRLPSGPIAVGTSFVMGFSIFALLFLAHARNAIGGGDVKLLSALSLGLPPIETVHFIVMTALAGGVVGLVYLGLARLHPVLRHGRDRFILRRLFIIECWRARRYRTVPYAVAIAAGAASVLLPAMLPARFVL